MPIAWEFRGDVLAVTETGAVVNPEIDRAFVVEALSDPRCATGARVLWDARAAQISISSEEMAWRMNTLASLASRGSVLRFALLWPEERRETLALVRAEMPKAVDPLEFGVFTEESEAAAWLRACP